jgi:hypothetical protein
VAGHEVFCDRYPARELPLLRVLVPPAPAVELAVADVDGLPQGGRLLHITHDRVALPQQLPGGPLAGCGCVCRLQVAAGCFVLAPRELNLPHPAIGRDVVRVEPERCLVGGQSRRQVHVERAAQGVLDRPRRPAID